MTLEFFTGLRQPQGAPVEPARLQDLVIKTHTYLTDCADPKSIPRNHTAVKSLEIPGCTMVCVHTHLSREVCVHTHSFVHMCTHCAVHTYFDWSAGTDTVPVLTGKSC